VPNDFAIHQVDDILGNVGREIRNPLEMTSAR
jgi:hypothetical protein